MVCSIRSSSGNLPAKSFQFTSLVLGVGNEIDMGLLWFSSLFFSFWKECALKHWKMGSNTFQNSVSKRTESWQNGGTYRREVIYLNLPHCAFVWKNRTFPNTWVVQKTTPFTVPNEVELHTLQSPLDMEGYHFAYECTLKIKELNFENPALEYSKQHSHSEELGNGIFLKPTCCNINSGEMQFGNLFASTHNSYVLLNSHKSLEKPLNEQNLIFWVILF